MGEAIVNYLYHGSKFANNGKPLTPGFFHSGEEVFWDGKFESNRYLYACDNKDNAILLGIGSMAEKEFNTIGFVYELNGDEAHFLFETDELITEKELQEKLKDKSVYLYTIRVKREHEWIENKNACNNIEGEYKTLKHIPSKDYVQSEIKVMQWLEKNNWKIVTRVRAT